MKPGRMGIDRPKTAKKKKKESDGPRWEARDGVGGPDGRKIVGEDPSKMISELTPGKKGGDFNLPFGGHVTIHSGTFERKDVVTCCMVSPSNRFKYLPPLKINEKLLSEIFLFSTSRKSLKRPVTLTVPYQPDNLEICEVILMMKSVKDEDWRIGECKFSEQGHFAEIEVEHPGIYVMVSTPRVERFDVPALGCLHNTKLSRQISVRFPRKATDVDMTCDIQILPLNRGNLPMLRQEHPLDMEDLVTASDFYDIKPSIQKEFRRPITVKLPLPPLDTEEFPADDMVVMQYSPTDGWTLVDSTYKFTKSSISFDTRVLTKFCVVLSKPQRKKRMVTAFAHIQRELNVTRGEVLPFIHIQEKQWTLWFDCVKTHEIEETVNKRLQQGFRRIEQTVLQPEPETDPKKIIINRRHWKSRAKNPDEPKHERKDLDIVAGRVYELEIGGDILICEDDVGRNFTGLHYHEKLRENYRRFNVEPKEIEEGKTLTAILKINVDEVTPEEGIVKKCLRTYDFDVESTHIKAYFYVEPEPEPEPEVIRTVIIEPPEEKPAPPPTPKVKVKPVTSQESWLRLITPTKPPRQVSKESKVLSGKSLMVLAREVEQGLTLAIYLDLNDSTITGMGFDALAKGQSLVDITYRILLLWKRKTSKQKDRQIHGLVRALQEMGRQDAASIILEKHRENVELAPEHFESH